MIIPIGIGDGEVVGLILARCRERPPWRSAYDGTPRRAFPTGGTSTSRLPLDLVDVVRCHDEGDPALCPEFAKIGPDALPGLGIEPERVKLVWASAAEGARFASETTLFVEEIRKLGPLNWGKGSRESSVITDPVIGEQAPEEAPV